MWTEDPCGLTVLTTQSAWSAYLPRLRKDFDYLAMLDSQWYSCHFVKDTPYLMWIVNKKPNWFILNEPPDIIFEFTDITGSVF